MSISSTHCVGYWVSASVTHCVGYCVFCYQSRCFAEDINRLIFPGMEPLAFCCLASSAVTILATLPGLLPVMLDGRKCVLIDLNYGGQNLFADVRPGSKWSDLE